jgi:hypothetical protein
MSIFQFMPWYFIPVTLLGLAIPLVMVVRLIKGSAERSRILSRGVPAQATILRIWETGVRINDQPQVGFELQVQTPQGHTWVAQSVMTVSTLLIPRIQPGAVVPVKYDPADASKVAVVL